MSSFTLVLRLFHKPVNILYIFLYIFCTSHFCGRRILTSLWPHLLELIEKPQAIWIMLALFRYINFEILLFGEDCNKRLDVRFVDTERKEP